MKENIREQNNKRLVRCFSVKGGAIAFKKEIDKSKNGIEFFLEMYSSIDVKDNIVFIRGIKDVEYLPLKIIIEKNNLVF